MTSQQLDEEAIFHIARDLKDAEKRETYLDQVCAGDQALRERVAALLEVHDQEQSFLKSGGPVAQTADQPHLTEKAGQEIGRYKLLQKIGEGGFGVVYMAEQHRPVRRKVAIKIIKPGMDTQAVIARFEAERQALAMMDHPNIARVFDGGATDEGRPYFVMELVKGVPITEYCDKNELSTEQRLKLFATVCQAVQHAHQKGIIHRDLKPSNVLVTLADGEPVAKVIDFGVAKATNQQLTEKTLFTAFGQMVGTPQYMSPEQAEMSCLDVDTRSDVYSLGVLLYELLTGTTPLEADRLRSAGYAEMQRMIREEEPPKPSTRLSTFGDKLTMIAKHRKVTPEKLKSQVKGDLDWVVMKALEKDRRRRYDSPISFASDIANYLSKEPVVARPPTLQYRSRKYLSRNRWPILVITLVIFLLAGGLAMTISQRRRTEGALIELRLAVVEHAKKAILNADFETAKELLKDAKDKDIQLGRTLTGIVAFYEGRYHEAIEEFRHAKDQDSEDVAALAMLSAAQHLTGSWMEAKANRRRALAMPLREDHAALDRVCQAQAQILDNRAVETAQRLGALHEDDKKPLVSVVLSHALAHCAFEWDPRSGRTEDIKTQLDEARNLVDSTKNVTEGFHFLNMIRLFITLMDMHYGKQTGDPSWRAANPIADEIAEQLLNDEPCETAYMMVAEYYRLTRSEDDVEAIYKRLHDRGWDRFKLVCLHASRGIEVDWKTLSMSEREDDRLAAFALSNLPIPDLSMAATEITPLTAVGVLLARQKPEEARGLARSIRDTLDASPESASEKRFDRLCLQNLINENDLSDEGFLAQTRWPLQARYRLGLKHYAQRNYPTAKAHFDAVIESQHPQVFFNERAHWAAVLRERIRLNEAGETSD